MRMRVAGGMAVLLALLIPRPVSATPITASLTLTFDPPAGSPFAGGTLTNLLFQFWVVDALGRAAPPGPAERISPPGPNDRITDLLTPRDIPLGATDVLAFSLAGFVAQPPPPNDFPAWAFPPGTTTWLPPGPGDMPPLVVLGMLGGVPLEATGPLVGFASPGTQIGTYALTVTPVPEPASLTLLGLGLVGLVARRFWADPPSKPSEGTVRRHTGYR